MRPHHTIDEDRLRSVPGPVLDIGCLKWDWSRRFAGKREVIGVDPFEQNRPEWAELIQACVSISDGSVAISSGLGLGNTCMINDAQKIVPAISFQRLIHTYRPAIVKLNVEGAEYPLLMAVHHPVSDQLVVAFHDQNRRSTTSTISAFATECVLNYLSNWYDVKRICSKWEWYLFLDKRSEERARK